MTEILAWVTPIYQRDVNQVGSTQSWMYGDADCGKEGRGYGTNDSWQIELDSVTVDS
jgi:hypothetical protein